jgi:hypothetical protein
MMPKKEKPLEIFKEGTWFYVGRRGEFKRTRTGAGLRGFMNARRYIWKKEGRR